MLSLRHDLKEKLIKLLFLVFIFQSLGALPQTTSAAPLPTLARPTGVSASRDANGVVSISWTSDSNALGYVVVIDSSGTNKNTTIVLGPSVTSIKTCYQFTGGTDIWVVDKTGSGTPTLTQIEATAVNYHYVTSGGKPSCASSFTNKYDYNITLNANTGVGSDINLVGNDYSITLPANTFTKSGYSFAGWTTLSGGGGTSYADEATITLTANTTQILYAKWLSDSAPLVTTNAASSVTADAATLNANISRGSLTSGYFCKSTTQPTGSNFSLPCTDTVTATASLPNYSASLTSLAPGKYYFEFVGVSGASEYQGGVKSFTTVMTVTDTTTAASSINTTSATLNGELSGLDEASVSDNYFLISTTNPPSGHLNPSTDDSITATSAFTGNPFTFTANKTGLTASTTYYFELVIVDTSSNKYFGTVKTFTTSAAPAPAPAPVYIPHPPTITNISAPEVCAVGSQLSITGTYLSGATATVDGVAAQVLSSSYGSMLISLPTRSIGTKTIVVTNVDGTASTSVKYKFVDTPVYVNYIYPETFKNKDFTYTFTATNAEKYSVIGTMPAGLTLNPLTGELSGAPTVEGNFVFTIVASNYCDDAHLIVYMFVDREIPNTFTCSVAFNVPKSDNITDIKLSQLKTCLGKITTLTPKYIEPIIYLSGGLPAGLSPQEALVHPRYIKIIDFIKSIGLDYQIYVGAFGGTADSVQINVYWPST